MLNIITDGNPVSAGKSKAKCITKPIKDMLLDSSIIAGVTAFSIWSGTPSIADLSIVLKATGLSFFIQLAYYRGIKKVI